MWAKEKRNHVIDTITKFLKDMLSAIFNNKPKDNGKSEKDDKEE